MLTFIIIVVAIVAAVFVAMKIGKVEDKNNNNIPDAIENKVADVKEAVAEVKAEVKEAVEKVKKAAPKKPAAKKSVKKEK